MSLGDDYREVAQRLNERIEWLAPELLPNGSRQGRRWWRVGSLSGEPGRSLVVELGGAKRGKWRDYASGANFTEAKPGLLIFRVGYFMISQ